VDRLLGSRSKPFDTQRSMRSRSARNSGRGQYSRRAQSESRSGVTHAHPRAHRKTCSRARNPRSDCDDKTDHCGSRPSVISRAAPAHQPRTARRRVARIGRSATRIVAAHRLVGISVRSVKLSNTRPDFAARAAQNSLIAQLFALVATLAALTFEVAHARIWPCHPLRSNRRASERRTPPHRSCLRTHSGKDDQREVYSGSSFVRRDFSHGTDRRNLRRAGSKDFMQLISIASFLHRACVRTSTLRGSRLYDAQRAQRYVRECALARQIQRWSVHARNNARRAYPPPAHRRSQRVPPFGRNRSQLRRRIYV